MEFVRNRKAGGCSKLVAGVILTIVGACLLWFLGSDITLTCKRSSDSCILEKTSMLGRKEVVASLPLSRVKSALVESHQSRGKGGKNKPTYQIVLKTEDSSIPFSNAWTRDIAAHKQNAAHINTYLSSSEESLVVVQSAKTVRMVCYLFLAVGVLALLGGFWGIVKMFLSLGSIFSARG
jgi:hypothetical protein